MHARSAFLALLVFILLGAAPARAQTELEQARASLIGVDGFYLSVNLEGPASVVEQEAMDLPALRARLAEQLQAAGLPLLLEADVSAAERLPYLHIHLNVMEADRGQLPFAVEVRFFQAVRLVQSGHLVPASTWETSIVGLTYPNGLLFISEATAALVDEFVEDFQRVNL